MSQETYTKKKRIIRSSVLAAFILLIGAVYLLFDPSKHLFPKCPFLLATGWQCPGCGSQRAMHHLLNGEIASAWGMNPLLLAAIPYLFLGFTAEMLGSKYKWSSFIREKLFGATAAWTVLVVIIIYTVLRNIF